MRKNWPEIKEDLHDAAELARGLAAALRLVGKAVQPLVSMIPGGFSSLGELLGGYLIARKAAAALTALAGAEVFAGTSAAGAAGKVALLRGSLLKLVANPYVLTVALVTIGAEKIAHDIKRAQQGYLTPEGAQATGTQTSALVPRLAAEWTRLRAQGVTVGAAIKRLEAKLGDAPQASTIVGDAINYAANGPMKKRIDALAQGYHKLGQDATGTWKDVAAAQAATGVGLTEQTKKLKELVRGEQAAARQTVSLLTGAASRLASHVGQAFDAQTQQMLDNLSTRVEIVTKGIRESFTLKAGGQTPAERELAALDAIEQKRQLAQAREQARADLRSALTDRKALHAQTQDFEVGTRVYSIRSDADPEALKSADERVRQAREAVRQADLAATRNTLEQKATIERSYDDKALAHARTELEATRKLAHEQLDLTLKGIVKQVEQGKLGASQATSAILRTLNGYGLGFKTAGDLLGKSFASGFGQSLRSVQTQADQVQRALAKLLRLKQRLAKLEAPAKQPLRRPQAVTRPSSVSGPAATGASAAAQPLVHVEHMHVTDPHDHEKVARQLAYR